MPKTHKEKLAILQDLNKGYRVGYVLEMHKINRREFYNSFQRTYCGDWELKGKSALPLKVAELEKFVMSLPLNSAIISELQGKIFDLREAINEQIK